MNVVICGSYKYNPDKLTDDYQAFEAAGHTVLSPLAKQEKYSFIAAKMDLNKEKELEESHLLAIEQADFIWVHAPNGYLGLSGAMEIGYALALNKPIYSRQSVADPTLTNYVQQIDLANLLKRLKSIS